MHAGGGLLTTAIDITKYMQLHLNKGRLGDRQIVPEVCNYFLDSGRVSRGDIWRYQHCRIGEEDFV